MRLVLEERLRGLSSLLREDVDCVERENRVPGKISEYD